MTTALVTGGSGFVGANLVRRLLSDGVETHLLLRPAFTPWRLDEVQGAIRRYDGDVSDPDAVDRALRASRPDWVFHLAAYGAYPHQVGPQQMIRTNIGGAAAVISAALNADVQAVVLAGSSSEYGLKDHAPNEDEVLDPDSDYAITKAAATLYAMKEARRTGVSLTVLRLYSAFGPWEEPSRLWPTIVTAGIGGALPQLASPRTARDFVYVDDVADAFVRAAVTQSRGIYNIASGVQTTLADVVGMVRARFDIGHEPVWGTMGDRIWDTDVWVGDASRAHASLGWSATTSVVEGLERLTRWLLSDPKIVDRYRSGIIH